MKTLKITIGILLIVLCSCSKMDTNTGSGKVRMIKEFNNWIVDKTTSEPNLDEKIELQLDSITSQVKKVSLYPDELEMEVLKTTNLDLNKVVNECWILPPSAHSLKRLSEEEKAKVLAKFKADNTSFRLLSLRFRNRINDNQVRFEYLNVLFDQNGDYALLDSHTSLDDISSDGAIYQANIKIGEIIKGILFANNDENNIEKQKENNIREQKTDNNITYFTHKEFDNFPPSGRKDFMEHNLEWIEKTRKEDTKKIKNDEYLSSTDKAEYLKEIEDDYAKRIEGVKIDGECRFK